MKLQLSPDLSLPPDAATRRLAILGMSGAGKSNVAVVLAEQMFDAGIPWVAIDPKGDWWGVRSNRTGKGPGLPIPIFGGLHADVQINATAIAGRELADVIVAKRLTCIVDVSEFTDRQAMWGFLAAFGETLLHKNRSVLHLFLEEADEYLPQKTSEKGNLPKCLGVWQRVVKRGRFRGLGSTQITQRSAALNKDTLYQAEVLIALRSTGKGDRDAVKGWVEHHNAAAEIVASLPTLADGEGWCSSPAWLRKTERVQFARRRTFDSGSTPVLLEPNAKPATLADIDLSAIEREMANAVERAQADDPRLLRQRIAQLEKELARRPQPIAETKTIEVPIISPEQIEAIKYLRDDLAFFSERLRSTIEQLNKVLTLPTPAKAAAGAPAAKRQPSARAVVPTPKRAPAPPAPQNGNLAKCERAILTVLAQYPLGQRKNQIALKSEYSIKSSSFHNALSALRTSGFITGAGQDTIRATGEGLAALGDFEPLPSGAELLEYWIRNLGKCEAAILRYLGAQYPHARAKDETAEGAGYSVTSSSFHNALSRLRTLELIEGRHELKASDVFFED